jgi:hypothetical protein
VAFSYALQNSLQTLSVLIVGQLNSDALSCAAFSYMIAMCTTWTIALGGGTALDTLASSLFSSSSASPFEVGIVLQRAFIILYVDSPPIDTLLWLTSIASRFLLHLPFALLWCFISPVLLALGQTPQLASDVQSFLRVLCFGAPGTICFIKPPLVSSLNLNFSLGYIAFESVKKYLQVQGESPLRRCTDYCIYSPLFNRNYARINPSSRDYFASQRPSQLVLHILHTSRSLGCASSYIIDVLDLLWITLCVLQVGQRVSRVGGMESKMFEEMVSFRAVSHPRNSTRWY